VNNWCSDQFPKSDPGCGKDFGSLRDFDAHLVKDDEGWPHCLSTSALADKGWQADEKDIWHSPEALGKIRQFKAAGFRKAQRAVPLTPGATEQEGVVHATG
jgi:hypothetical protein